MSKTARKSILYAYHPTSRHQGYFGCSKDLEKNPASCLCFSMKPFKSSGPFKHTCHIQIWQMNSHHSTWQRDISDSQLLAISHTSSWYPWPNRAFRRWLLPKQRNRPPTWEQSNGDPNLVLRAAHAPIWSYWMFGEPDTWCLEKSITSLGAWRAMWAQEHQELWDQRQWRTSTCIRAPEPTSVIRAFPCNIQTMSKHVKTRQNCEVIVMWVK